ncbi:hypothetical protein DFS34DRAFT_629748 [Phlyctochytrium arcticum]|nr:hypothetical protein DFS34DRAFT_629748 [Phlyctochytrium arcticum]
MAPVQAPAVAKPAPMDHIKAKSIESKLGVTTEGDVAPWRSALEACIKKNYEGKELKDYQVSLATIRPFGRPANRLVSFTGFLTDIENTTTTAQPTPKAQGSHSTELGKNAKIGNALSSFLKDLMGGNDYDSSVGDAVQQFVQQGNGEERDHAKEAMVFVADARSKVVDDVIFGSRFTEVGWPMPKTGDQFRLSGKLYPILPPTHPLKATGLCPPHPSKLSPTNSASVIDWEAQRQTAWKALSDHKKQTLSQNNGGDEQVDSKMDEHVRYASARRFSIVEAYSSTPSSDSVPAPRMTAEPKSDTNETPDTLALLILDVDGVDYHRADGTRFKFRRATSRDGQSDDEFSPYEGKIKHMNHWLMQSVE